MRALPIPSKDGPSAAVRLPDRLSFAEGAAYCLNYVTALFTLRRAQRHRGVAGELVVELERLAATGAVHPCSGHRLPVERAREALGRLDRREALGKVVIEAPQPA